MNERQTGTVRWFNDSKGFGFINVDGEKKRRAAVHYSNIQGAKQTLTEGQRVEFRLVEGKEGFHAEEVRPL